MYKINMKSNKERGIIENNWEKMKKKMDIPVTMSPLGSPKTVTAFSCPLKTDTHSPSSQTRAVLLN